MDENASIGRLGDGAVQVWTERMREWLASQLLQPLVAAINAAHKVLDPVLHSSPHHPARIDPDSSVC